MGFWQRVQQLIIPCIGRSPQLQFPFLDSIVNFFGNSTAVSQTIALETAAVVQMTIDGVKRSAQQQVNRALKDHTRYYNNYKIYLLILMKKRPIQPNKSSS
uniref:Uncharacterized protein n=1 Tax=Nelumbo nucifera TaxID=4432 RepID=A0A822Z063_NELNU|nr:TPA_asm: hypothetical protein HUJ06_009003 [Nelumbo nucifera]